jgi:hypothetical protein
MESQPTASIVKPVGILSASISIIEQVPLQLREATLLDFLGGSLALILGRVMAVQPSAPNEGEASQGEPETKSTFRRHRVPHSMEGPFFRGWNEIQESAQDSG